ncbi:Crp/Fnr family transcriptional regulator [Marivirga atlantica]|uniref:Crp/Fnr family transcriptional regulator n=1 Tax=Marivirga atlantica TaxID=1548457 RepID=A0A937ADV9_9BACT|nr:Crp/Fnr family transcriptional regulator [Marivirga atlantica]MBL0764896.1 Crp/Fnr family transcriptional regulator [Marivirga atlantica]
MKNFLGQMQVLTGEEVEIIAENTILKDYKKGSLLLKEGEIPKYCYMVLSGCVREFVIIDGEEKSTAFYTEGDKITSYTDQGKGFASKHYLECIENCILTISTENFEEELRKLVPRLDAIIIEVAKEKSGKEKQEWTKFISSSPEERYQNLMETRPTLLNRVPQVQLASFLGIKPESLSRLRKRIHEKNKQA